MKTAWYLGHKSSDVGEGAILVGDPDRIDRIAAHLGNPVFLPVSRGLRTVTGTFGGRQITAVSFGMGAPIASIVMSELNELGTKSFLRVGTAMYFPPASAGSLMMSDHIMSFDGTSTSYADDVNSARASSKLNKIANDIILNGGEKAFTGTFATYDAFYRDMFPLDQGSKPKVDENCSVMVKGGAIASDMETAALVNVAHYLKVDFTSICVATVHGHTREKLHPDVLAPREGKMFEIALKTLTAK